MAHVTHIPQIILNTSRDVGDLREQIGTFYDDIFVQYAIKSPAYDPGQPLVIQEFNAAVDRWMQARGLLR